MRRKTFTAMLLVVLAGLTASPAGAASGSGVQGMIRDGTCAASCVPPCQPPPCVAKPGYACPQRAGESAIVCPADTLEMPLYVGEANVVVRLQGSRRVLAHRTAREGSFSIGLDAGRYLVAVAVAGRCWVGQTKRLRVEPGMYSALDLVVRDGCIVRPGG